MLQQFSCLQKWADFRNTIQEKTLGFVPTMGALHEGHLSLIQRSQQENDYTLVSIFVNPTQFNQPDDLQNYPQPFDQDVQLLKDKNVDCLLTPTEQDLYPDNYSYRVIETCFSTSLCGATRPGHFTGVLTVVLKLLNLAQATRAYFGEKDYQQLSLISGMAKAFFLPTQIVGCPTVRDQDGLALSSRNLRLKPQERAKASLFPQLLKSSYPLEKIKQKLEENGFKIDYIEDHNNRRFGAVFLGNVRLIDNVLLEHSL
jgi:pantoate--beta-alanine ligase